jgi:hypothetical protein
MASGLGLERRRCHRSGVGHSQHIWRFRYPSRLTLAWRLASRTAGPSTSGGRFVCWPVGTTSLLKPALSSINGRERRNRQLDSLRTFSPILVALPVRRALPVGELPMSPRSDAHRCSWWSPATSDSWRSRKRFVGHMRAAGGQARAARAPGPASSRGRPGRTVAAPASTADDASSRTADALRRVMWTRLWRSQGWAGSEDLGTCTRHPGG